MKILVFNKIITTILFLWFALQTFAETGFANKLDKIEEANDSSVQYSYTSQKIRRVSAKRRKGGRGKKAKFDRRKKIPKRKDDVSDPSSKPSGMPTNSPITIEEPSNMPTSSPTTSPSVVESDVVPGAFGCPASPLENLPESPIPSCSFDSIIVFGDSLLDVGSQPTLGDVCLVLACAERNSDGNLFIERLASALGIGPLMAAFDYGNSAFTGGTNFAVSGFEARPAQSETDNTLDIQVALYQLALATSQLAQPTSQTLFFIGVGANDLVNAAYSLLFDELGETTPVTAAELVQLAVLGVTQVLQTLLSTPNVCNVVLSGIPDVGSLPLILNLDAFYANLGVVDYASNITELTLQYNAGLALAVDGVASEFDAKCRASAEFGIKYVDLFSIAKEAQTMSGLMYRDGDDGCNMRFTSSAETCIQLSTILGASAPFFLTLSTDDSRVACGVGSTLPNSELQCNCEGLLYFDEVHPSDAFGIAVTPLFLEQLGSFCSMS